MRVLLDNCIPQRFGDYIAGHHIKSVRDIGWAQMPDARLLDAMAGEYDALVTVDKSLRFQQNLARRPFGVLVLRAKSNRLVQLMPMVPVLLLALKNIKPGEAREIW